MDFLFTFLNFLQPGILWPALAEYRPFLTIALLMAAVGYFRTSLYPRAEAFRHPIFLYLSAFLGVQVLSVYYSGGRSMLDEFNYWSVYIEFVIISILLINEPPALRRYVWGMIAGSMVIVFYGIYAVYAGLPSAVGGRAGAYGMYENHNDYSFIIIMSLPYMYMFWKTHSGTSVRLLLVFFMLSCVAGIFLSLSRGGVLAPVLEAMLIVLFAVERGKRFRYFFLIALLGTAALRYHWA